MLERQVYAVFRCDLLHSFHAYFLHQNCLLQRYNHRYAQSNIFENIMTRRDKDKVSLVEFLRSIKFTRHNNTVAETECPTHFAHFNQHARSTGKDSKEDSKPIRSAN